MDWILHWQPTQDSFFTYIPINFSNTLKWFNFEFICLCDARITYLSISFSLFTWSIFNTDTCVMKFWPSEYEVRQMKFKINSIISQHYQPLTSSKQCHWWWNSRRKISHLVLVIRLVNSSSVVHFNRISYN